MKLTTKQYWIALLMIATGVLHLAAAFDKQLFPAGPDPLFTLNGIGYLGLMCAYILPIKFFQERHALVWRVLFGYVILTIVAWVVIWVGFNVIRDGVPFFSHDSLYGVPAKIVEVILLYLLWQEKP